MADEDVGKLVSLLEGTVSAAAARRALDSAGGSIEGAIRRLFECGPAPEGPAGLAEEEARSEGSLSEGARSDLEAEGPKRPGRPGHAVRPRPRPRAATPRPPRRSAAPPAAAASLAPRPPKRPRFDGEAAAAEAWPSGTSANATRPALPAARAGWARAKAGEWTLFAPPDAGDAALGGPAWVAGVLAKDPPCLTLRGHKLEDVPKESTGEMRAGILDEGVACTEYLARTTMWDQDGHANVETSLLQALFSDLLARVRYPPSSLELSWRITPLAASQAQRWKVVPRDLSGPLPPRPFQLLNNSEDPPAAQPPRFSEHLLRSEQLRSLSWMLACEGHAADAGAEPAGAEPLAVEWRRFWTPGSAVGKEGALDQLVEGAAVRLVEGAEGPVFDVATRDIIGHPPLEEGILASCPPGGLAMVNVRGKGSFLCAPGDLEFVDHGGIEIGCLVRLALGLKAPVYGWGGVSPGAVGVLLRMEDRMMVVRFEAHPSWKGLRTEVQRADGGLGRDRPYMLDLRVQAAYPVRGGILADRIGYGKTATMIGLMDATMDRPPPPIPDFDKGRFIPAKGTLIVVPSNLFEQWLAEISKFVWGGKPLRAALRKGWSPEACPWKIFAMSNVRPLTFALAGQLAEADVVLCSYRLLFSPIYQERKKELAGGASLADLVESTSRFLSGAGQLRSGRKGDACAACWQDLEFPILEMFHWRRVVFDEFHELESFESLQQNSLQHIRAGYRWGLTGTPPVDGSAGVVFMSSLFRVDLPGSLAAESPAGYPDLVPWESDRLLAELSGRFLDRLVRQNTAELPQVRLEEHVVVVQHSAAERALYLAQAHDAPHVDADEGLSAEHVQELERLLKLCSHFQAVGDNMANAEEECERIGEQKERRVVRARNQLRRCAHVVELLRARLPKKKGSGGWRAELAALEEKLPAEGESGQRAVEALEQFSREAAEALPEARLGALEHHRPRDAELSELLGAADSRKGCSEQWAALVAKAKCPETLTRLLGAQAREQAENLRELHEASASLGFFRRTMKSLAQSEVPESRSCTVCLEEGLPLTRLAITPCAHMFCLECLKMTVTKFASCSICRQPLSLKDIRPLEAELSASAPRLVPPEAPSASSSSSSLGAGPTPELSGQGLERKASQGGGGPEELRFDKYGTKLAALVRKLEELRKDDPTAKVILFVQFDDLKRKVAAALDEFGVPAVQLHGSVEKRANVIRDWQHNPTSASYVLLLSLAQSASGTNLTAASHVVFLHPMLAPTPERAVGFEMQAIGRARRFGQMREAVHVWRFVTAGTVEQTMTERHQSSLWAREQARANAPPAAAA